MPKEEMTVVKQKALMLPKAESFGIAEYKVLDAFLMGVFREKNIRTVSFRGKELAELLGVKRVYRDDLVRIADNLTKTVSIKENKKITKVNLFSLAEIEVKNNDLLFSLTATPEGAPYLCMITNQYFMYPFLKDAKTTHEYRLAMYIYANSFRETWDIDQKELRSIILDEEKDYIEKNPKDFTAKILKKDVELINQKTDYVVKVFSIDVRSKNPKYRFFAKKKIQRTATLNVPSERFDDFSHKEVTDLYRLAGEKIIDASEEQIKAYLDNRIEIMRKAAPQKKYAYLKRMIENDILEQGPQRFSDWEKSIKEATQNKQKRKGIIFQASMRDYGLPTTLYEDEECEYEEDDFTVLGDDLHVNEKLPDDFWALGALAHPNEKYLEEGNPYREIALKYQERYQKLKGL